ncbi:endo-1,3(4)-beta-glucanase [Limtongia smithiae]|uniref:endo-1,3(4)-beta-glucanase n=1 Tax=Limtongia smithiae TaxID=1125753 RepID=UPI0034CD55F1
MFEPIATTAPYSAFPTVSHPLQPVGISSNVLGKSSIPTNNFYTNMMLGEQTNPAYVYPYSVWWDYGTSSTYGLGISHREASERTYGPDADADPVEYYINASGVMSLSLSAIEFDSSMNMTLEDLDALSVTLVLAEDSTHYIEVPLVQGAGFVTGIYYNVTPRFDSTVGITSITKEDSPRSGIQKYTVALGDDTTWAIYATLPSGQSLSLSRTSGTTIEASASVDGVVIQIAKIASGSETYYDDHAGMYAVSASINGTAHGTTGQVDIHFTSSGSNNAGYLLQFALPHHVSSFSSTIANRSLGFLMQSPTRGNMTAYSTNDFIMIETLPLNISFAPWTSISGKSANYTSTALGYISMAAVSEIQQDMVTQSNGTSMYAAGKALDKFAMICYVAHSILKNTAIRNTCITNLKEAFAVFKNNSQEYPLDYDKTYRGVISSASIVTGDSGDDYGNTYYNDHHFHYGYHIHAAAIIGMIDTELGGTWVSENKAYVNSLVRDVANPSSEDTYFPISRSFNWFYGHSLAKGVFESADGKDQESSSEDYHHAYGIKLWAEVIGDHSMLARSSMTLAIMRRAMNDYILMNDTNTIQPANFIGNKVAGIIFENKCDHTTYFGTYTQYIQGIHMIPITPMSSYIRGATFVEQEWNEIIGDIAPDLTDGWKGIIYANEGLFDPEAAYDFFAVSDFNSSYLDDGASLTWYLAYLAGVGGTTA